MIAALSFCNEERSPEKGVALVDLLTGTGTWTALGTERPIMGTRGLYAHENKFYAAYTVGWDVTRIATYAIFGTALQLIDDVELPAVVDPHSICVHDGALIVASTGSDAVLGFDLHAGSVRPHGQTLWRASASGEDTEHVNAVCSTGKRLLVSAFGPRSGEFWSSAHRGYVRDLTEDRLIFGGLFHPHSLMERDGEIFILESGLQQLRATHRDPIKIPGYLRGLTHAGASFAVGANAARTLSRSRGIVMNANNVESPGGASREACSVAIVDAADGTVTKTIDVSRFGRELYDIVIVD